MIKSLSLAALTLLLVSCAPITKVTTNLDAKNFRHYFAPSQVTIYERIADLPAQHKLIGLVEGDNCQEKPHHAIPDKLQARTMARRNAFEQGANAIVFSSCVEIQTKACHANIVCYGQAYQVASE